MLKDAFDVLFVINQDTDIIILHRLVTKRGYKKILFLTTHFLFETERQNFSSLFNNPLIVDFASILSEDEMTSCDDRASNELLVEYNKSAVVREYYNERFMCLSLKYKNEIVARKIVSRFKIAQGYFSSGLGIDPDVWSHYLFESLLSVQRPRLTDPIRFGFRIAQLLLWFLTSRTVYIIRNDVALYIFFCSVHRLNLAVEPDTARFIPWHFWFSGNLSRRSVVNGFLKNITQSNDKVVIGTTVHNYEFWLTELAQPLQIFVDGFHPSNYPRSYIDSFPVGEFVVRNMFDNIWFEKFGKKTVKPGPFLQIEYFSPIVDINSPVHTVCLLLNHAGDWSALINRSDTDILVQQFVDTARKMPHINFVIRPHPTMVYPAHEGRNSLSRIELFVKQSDLANLKISRSSLESDLETADLFVSEYSQTILNVYKTGKNGLIANVTNRRSFMTDYESLGFNTIDPGSTLYDAIQAAIDKPVDFSLKQNKAVKVYNDMLMNFIGDSGNV